MNATEKKNLIIRETIIPAFKNAGYRVSNFTFHAFRNDCRVIVKVQSSQFNSDITGASFWFNISVLPVDIPLREYNTGRFYTIDENILLNDYGYLHPYRTGGKYCIDGYKNYQAQNMDLNKIQKYLLNDLQEVILPQLAEIHTLLDWKLKRLEWRQRENSQRILLLRYFSVVQMMADIPEMVAKVRQSQLHIGLNSNFILANEFLYHEIRNVSRWPDDDKWHMILSSLQDEIE